MKVLDIKTTINAWSSLADKVVEPHAEEEYEKLVTVLDSLIDEVGGDESHPLASLMEVIGVLVLMENYQNQYVPELTEDS